MTSIADTFNRANGDLNGSTTSDGLRTWVVQNGAFSIVSNQAQSNAANTNFATIDTANANGTAQVTVPAIDASNRSGLLFRYVDTSNWWGMIVKTGAGGSLCFYKQAGGNHTVQTFTAVAGDVLSVVCSGSTVTFKQNGTTIATDSTGLFSTSTKFGLYGEILGGQTYDSWSFTDGVAPPAPRRPIVALRRVPLIRAAVR